MSEDRKINLKGIVKGVLISLVITMVFVIITALICYFADVPDGIISIILYIISAVSVFASSLFLAKSISNNGLLHGLILGAGYFIVIFIFSAAFKQQVGINMKFFISMSAALASGMLGGILGVNTKE